LFNCLNIPYGISGESVCILNTFQSLDKIDENLIDHKYVLDDFQIIPTNGIGTVIGITIETTTTESSENRFLLENCTITHNSGKSKLIKAVMRTKSFIPISQIFSGTEEANRSFSLNVPDSLIFNELNNEAVKSFMKRQKYAIKYHLRNPWAMLVVDDCFDKPAQFRDPLWLGIFKNSRHYNMLTIIALQWVLDLLPNERAMIDYAFMFAEPNENVRSKLWKNFGSVVGPFNDFCDILTATTEDHRALMFKNLETSNKLEDRIGWYKADLRVVNSEWHFGPNSIWIHSSKRCMNRDDMDME
jgi:hypothetical protein